MQYINMRTNIPEQNIRTKKYVSNVFFYNSDETVVVAYTQKICVSCATNPLSPSAPPTEAREREFFIWKSSLLDQKTIVLNAKIGVGNILENRRHFSHHLQNSQMQQKKNSQERNFINVQDWILRSKNIKTFILEDYIYPPAL